MQLLIEPHRLHAMTNNYHKIIIRTIYPADIQCTITYTQQSNPTNKFQFLMSSESNCLMALTAACLIVRSCDLSLRSSDLVTCSDSLLSERSERAFPILSMRVACVRWSYVAMDTERRSLDGL